MKCYNGIMYVDLLKTVHILFFFIYKFIRLRYEILLWNRTCID